MFQKNRIFMLLLDNCIINQHCHLTSLFVYAITEILLELHAPIYAPSALFITNYIFCSTAGMVRSRKTCHISTGGRIVCGSAAPLPPAPVPASAPASSGSSTGSRLSASTASSYPADPARQAVAWEASQAARENKLIVISSSDEE